MAKRKFLLISAHALDLPLLQVTKIISENHSLEGHVIAPEEMAVATTYHPSGMFSANNFEGLSFPLTLHFLSAPQGDALEWGFDLGSLKKILRQIRPDFIWVHDEFTHSINLQILWHYRFTRRPRIIAYVAQNHTPGPHPLFYQGWPFVSRTRLKHLFLWPRLDGVVACATKSMECARRMGLPAKVPIIVNYLPVLGPQMAAPDGVALPWSPKDGSFTVGFAGALTEQKGWKVLLAAVERLPETFKVVVVGDGEQRAEVENCLKSPGLQSRVFFTGPLPMRKLLATYPLFDVLVLPSLSMSHSVEQFGRVLAEAMAWEVPVIGSDSGAIPETIGEAGLVVPEGNAPALAAAIQRLAADKNLGRLLGAKGLERYLQHYSCEAYARSLEHLFGLSLPA